MPGAPTWAVLPRQPRRRFPDQSQCGAGWPLWVYYDGRMHLSNNRKRENFEKTRFIAHGSWRHSEVVVETASVDLGFCLY